MLQVAHLQNGAVLRVFVQARVAQHLGSERTGIAVLHDDAAQLATGIEHSTQQVDNVRVPGKDRHDAELVMKSARVLCSPLRVVTHQGGLVGTVSQSGDFDEIDLHRHRPALAGQ